MHFFDVMWHSNQESDLIRGSLTKIRHDNNLVRFSFSEYHSCVCALCSKISSNLPVNDLSHFAPKTQSKS